VLQQLMFLVAGAPAGQDITDGFELILMQRRRRQHVPAG
jgi:hypothetical protein